MTSMECTTGIAGLDRVLKGVMPGDNVVWLVDEIDDYRNLVVPYAKAACRTGRRLIYFRFASHPALIAAEDGPEVHQPDPSAGFEHFVDAVHRVITAAGSGAIYVFDCLSELAGIWQADAMLGNFFMLTCPRLLEFQSLTYFAMYRNRHSPHAIKPIEETCQFMLDIFRRGERSYIRPVKVQYRSADVMNMIHVREGDEFTAVKSSAEIADLLSSIAWPGLSGHGPRDAWHREFQRAHDLVEAASRGEPDDGQRAECFQRLLGWLISGDDNMLALARRYFTLEDLVTIHSRMIGIGQIGGKAVGMLLARAIIRRHEPDLATRLEAHDSFYIGSGLYYTFLVRNRVWWIRQRQRDPATFLEELPDARELMFNGTFPEDVIGRFRSMLEYFGEAPYIVRSSSLLEDAYGNAFAGQYESVFCVNQGPLESRLNALLDAIRRVYASALSETALRYRERRGLLQRDEQMALLIMRVSGAPYGRFFYPHLAGVGLSYNPYVWNPDIDPGAGVVRLVFGLGTRAVDRADDDATRLVALNAPLRRPESSIDEIHAASQRKMDCLDMTANKLISGWFDDITGGHPDLPLAQLTTLHPEQNRPLLTFEPLLRETAIAADLRLMMTALAQVYGAPVDIEFAVNLMDSTGYRINLLQCRPLQIRNDAAQPGRPDVTPKHVLFHVRGPVIGASRVVAIKRLVIVIPETYAGLSEQQRYAVARMIGRVNQSGKGAAAAMLLIGPGRWGTRQPSLGVPVRFGEINHAAAVCELVQMHERLVPDASLGTHFLNELIESDMLYFVVDPKKSGHQIDLERLRASPNQLAVIVNDPQGLDQVLHVVDHDALFLEANMQEQMVRLFEG